MGELESVYKGLVEKMLKVNAYQKEKWEKGVSSSRVREITMEVFELMGSIEDDVKEYGLRGGRTYQDGGILNLAYDGKLLSGFVGTEKEIEELVYRKVKNEYGLMITN